MFVLIAGTICLCLPYAVCNLSLQSIISVIHVKVIKKQQGVINVWKERKHVWKIMGHG